MCSKKEIMDVQVDSCTMEETVQKIGDRILSKRLTAHTCVNAYKYVLMQKNSELRKSVVESDIISADGVAVVWASKLLGDPLPERVPGIDLMERMIHWASVNGKKVFFLGARKEVVEAVSKIYSDQYGEELVGGYRDGYFGDPEEIEVAKQIHDSGAELLFVAISSPKKENFIRRQKGNMPNVFLQMGVGGSFDVVCGKVPRAPRWMQDNGLEWLFRLLKEPRRMWRRYLIGNIEFISLVFESYFKKVRY